MVDVVADLDLVSVRLEGRVIAEHPRSWGNALTITDPDHVIAAACLREAFQHRCVRDRGTEVVLRDLADYDAAFGVDITSHRHRPGIGTKEAGATAAPRR